jgi:hypothetical protein
MNPIEVTMPMVVSDEEIPALEWHRYRADQERELADRSGGLAACDRHRLLAVLQERAADHGYQLQMVEDR